MKVIAVIGGLGSQMLKYAFFLSVVRKSEDIDCYIDTLLFEKHKMWNGYELERIFGIKAPNVKEILNMNELNEILESKYNHQPYILNKMCECGFGSTYLINRGKISKWIMKNNANIHRKESLRYLLDKCYHSVVGLVMKPNFERIKSQFSIEDKYPDEYINIGGNVYYDEFNHTSDIYIRDVKEEIIEAFRFPPICEEVNIEVSRLILSTHSVALHVRRTDHMYDNGDLFENNYYKKAVDYMNTKVVNPTYFIFSDDPNWCKENLVSLGLSNFTGDIHFVDWNNGEKSFRDMQLMTLCKNNILAISSFSWWGYYLSPHECKEVVAPNGYWFEVAQHF